MHPRHRLLLDLIATTGPEARVGVLAATLRVTPATVRRDLEALQSQGLVERTHGGACLSPPGRIEFCFRQRGEAMASAKRAIAAAVAALVRPGMTVSLDTGTTVLEVARALAPQPDLRVLTTSLAAAAALHGCPGIQLVLLGGLMRRDEPDLYGDLAEENLARFHVDLAVLGADGATPEGLWATDPAVVQTSRALIRSSDRRVLAADSSKFGHKAFVCFAEWSAIGTVVTDAGIRRPDATWARELPGLVVAAPLTEAQRRRTVP